MILKIAIRNLRKHRLTTYINVLGLTVGVAIAIIIGLYVRQELSFDQFHRDSEHIYRVLRKSNINGEYYNIGITSGPYAPALQQDFPDDISATTRVLFGNSLVQLDNKTFREGRYLYADPNFFQFFSFELLQGDPAKVLAQPNSIVLTESAAMKYFGNQNPIGKTLRVDNEYDVQVTGIAADAPANSHITFDLIGSMTVVEKEEWFHEWWNNALCTYVRLSENVSPQQVNAKLPAFIDKYMGADFVEMGHRIDVSLEPLAETYFARDTRYDPVRHGNKQGVIYLGIAALLLLFIACFNFINLTTAGAAERSKEMGIHKVIGAHRWHLIRQLMAENVLLVSISILASVLIVIQVLPWFNMLFDVQLQFPYQHFDTYVLLVGLGLGITLLSGLYPAWMMSGIRPSLAVKGLRSSGSRAGALRQVLVTGQFCISVILIIGVAIIQQQLTYLQQKDLGFNKEQILLVGTNNPEIRANRETFRQKLLQQSSVVHVAAMFGEPGGFHDVVTASVEGKKDGFRMRTAFADFNYLKTLDIQLAAGRDFSAQIASDSTEAILINEKAVQDLGWTNEDALGKRVVMTMFDTIPKRIIGVVKNYHFSSLHDQIEPLVISYSPNAAQFAIRLAANSDLSKTIPAIENQWKTLAPTHPFEYRFLDESFDGLYQNEYRQGRLFSIFAVVSMLIACLGIFGLSVFAATRRTKEIAVRKVLGASVSNIVTLLSKDFLKLVLIASVIAFPLASLLMNGWLNDFAYRMELKWTVFALAGAAAIVIALLAVSFQAIRAAVANPVKSLRAE